MNILLAAVAATSIATVQPSDPMPLNRMSAMQSQLPELCDRVITLTPTGGNYAETLLMYSGAETLAEKYFVIVVCQNYLKGKMAR
jgi:hypothetical protein